MTPNTISVRAAVDLAASHISKRPLLVVTDFDGTLSNIVNDPWAAEIIPLGRRALRALAAIDGVHVALLSGRSSRDVASRVRVGGAHYVGNHGMERGFVPRRGRISSLSTDVDEASHDAVHAAERLAEQLPSMIREPWFVVEHKPPSVALHWRAAPDIEAAAARVMAAVDQLDPDGTLERFAGRRVLELRPPGAVAKGEAFERLVDEIKPRSVVLLGDDVSDAMAFNAFRRLRERGVLDGAVVAVQARAEVPMQVLQAADIVLASPVDATRFLSALGAQARGVISVRPVQESDLPTLYEHQIDPVARAMAVFGGRDREPFMEHWAKILANPENVTRTALVDGEVAGNIGSWIHDGQRFVGYWMGREFWGRGVATEAMRLFLAEVVERPLYAWVALTNIGSVRVLQKSGFIRLEPQPPPNQTDVPEQLMVLR